MLQSKAARGNGFEVTMPKQFPNQEQQPFFRPDESDRAARAKRWIEQARGETANLQSEQKD